MALSVAMESCLAGWPRARRNRKSSDGNCSGEEQHLDALTGRMVARSNGSLGGGVYAFRLFIENRTFRVFVCRFAKRRCHGLGRRVESDGCEKSSRDGTWREAGDLRNR